MAQGLKGVAGRHGCRARLCGNPQAPRQTDLLARSTVTQQTFLFLSPPQGGGLGPQDSQDKATSSPFPGILSIARHIAE